jgi:deoxyribose-phosphate aldolase
MRHSNSLPEGLPPARTAEYKNPRLMPDPIDLAPLIDHTVLRPEATADEVTKACAEARTHGFAAVCVRPENVALSARLLAGSRTLPIAVVDFPRGISATPAKVDEARRAIAAGAQELDMVVNLAALHARDYALVFRDIEAVVEAARPRAVKVILETGALSREQKAIGAALAKAAGAAFVKTSTGFGPGGATVEDVAFLRQVVGPSMGVKASGGIRTAVEARKMIEAGATRIGASASVAIVTGGPGTAGTY